MRIIEFIKRLFHREKPIEIKQKKDLNSPKKASKLTVTPAGILIGNFPILDIFNPPINKYSKEPHHQS